MKIEIYVEGPKGAALVADFLPKFQVARDEDEAASRREYLAESAAAQKAAAEVQAVEEEEKPKRGRKTESKILTGMKEAVAHAKEPEPAIRATPEDRQPEPVAEEPEVVVGEVEDVSGYTRDDVKAALAAYAEKFGMPQAASEGVKLMGAPRISALPDDPVVFAAAVKALNEAVARG
jgi:hypothetical protein